MNETRDPAPDAADGRYARMLDAARVGTWEWDVLRDEVRWLGAHQARFGFAADAFPMSSDAFIAHVHPDDRAAFVEVARSARRQALPFRAEYRVLRADGDVVWVESAGVYERDDAGRAVRAIGLLVDITERKRAQSIEAALRERESLFAMVVAQSVDAIVVADLATSRFVEFNAAAYEQLGHTREGFAGLTIADLHAEGAAADLRAVVACLTARGSISLETRLRASDGALRDVHLRARHLRVGERDLAAVSWTDITERKLAEVEQERLREQLRQAQKMESIGRLAGGVAHDFNNLLTVQLGYCEFLRELIRPEDPAAEALDEINAAAVRASQLTRELLAFSRKQSLQPSVLDVNALVEGITRMLRRMLGEDITLTVRPAPAPAVVLADVGQLEQVVVNLAVNARDAMPSGGALTVEISRVELDERFAAACPGITPGPFVQIAVTDTGHGMDAELLGRIFEPFFTTKPPGVGTGLGLSTVYGIVRQSQGHVWAVSEPGRGSTFTVCLPRLEQEAPPAAPRGLPIALKGRGEQVLLVEDDRAMRELMTRMLRLLNYRPVAAASADAALASVERDGLRPDVVLCDVVLPGLHGPALIARIRATMPLLRVVYTSGYADHPIWRQEALELGTRLLPKPFALAQLGATLRAALG